MTWDQLRYQIWVTNKPFIFVWNWYSGGSHLMTVYGYNVDSEGGQWVHYNDPDGGSAIATGGATGDTCVLSYDAWVKDSSGACGAAPHTHGGDYFDFTYNGTRLIYNLATNVTIPVNSLSLAQAGNLAGTVISDRVVPFAITAASLKITGALQERVVQETGTQTLDFYYQIRNDSGSNGEISSLVTQNFSRFAVAAGFRPDSLGDVGVVNASRDISGSTITINTQPVAPGVSSHFILLMTNATASADHGLLTLQGSPSGNPGATATTQLSTDQPTN
jgi:hypothetical protein